MGSEYGSCSYEINQTRPFLLRQTQNNKIQINGVFKAVIRKFNILVYIDKRKFKSMNFRKLCQLVNLIFDINRLPQLTGWV